MATLELKGVGKSFGKTRIIDDLDLFVEEGELIVFVGPSGCGKSTLLRMIAGLETNSSGEIFIAGRCVDHLPPAERSIAMVFQSYALYPHKNVRIVREPDVFLFDEPLSNLDAALRVHMRVEILKLHQRLSNTMVYVTHDQVEAMTLADRIVVLREGHIEQVGTPMELYRKPANVFVAGFIGSPAMNFLKATAHNDKIELAGQTLGNRTSAVGTVTLGLRPEHLQLAGNNNADISLSGHVQVFEHLGGESFVHVELDDEQLLVAKLDGELEFTPGQPISLCIASDKCHVFGEDEQRLG